MYVLGMAMTKSNVYYAKCYENNKMVQYSSTVLYVALIFFVFLVAFFSIHWWWGLLLWLFGLVAQWIKAIVRNPIRMMSAMPYCCILAVNASFFVRFFVTFGCGKRQEIHSDRP